MAHLKALILNKGIVENGKIQYCSQNHKKEHFCMIKLTFFNEYAENAEFDKIKSINVDYNGEISLEYADGNTLQISKPDSLGWNINDIVFDEFKAETT
jgi:hypothetical protein